MNDQHNIGYWCTRRQYEAGRSERVAMRWLSPTLERRDYTFADLERQSNRFANVLAGLGFVPGEVFFTFLPRMPEQFFAFLGALKIQAITGTLFANFGPEALLDRVGAAGARGIVTKKGYLRKLTAIRDQLPSLKYILLVDVPDHLAPDVLSYPRLMAEAADDFAVPPTAPDIPALLHYTSGSTGKPKGALHVHGGARMQSLTATEVLGLRDDDVFWCTADQGWVTGVAYGIVGPWSLGVTQVHFGGGYHAEHWFELLERERVSVWYTAPTALRMLMREDESLPRRFDLSALRHIGSVGEPLNPEVVAWARRVLGKDVHDTWFQTETGAIMIANRPGHAVRPGSMGQPVAGIEPAILADDGTPLPDGEPGQLCLRAGWPSMFVAYLGDEAAYRDKFRAGYYYTGDTAWRDADGYFWFQGRGDDVINTAGHLVSPFEVESALLEVAEVAEAGVVGVPDALLHEKVVAFVSLRRPVEFSPELELKIRLHVSNKLSSVATPHEIIRLAAIPKNNSGKIMRRVLKARYLGTDAGDLSTLEEQP